VTVLPEGIDVEVLKTGGSRRNVFSIDHAAIHLRAVVPRIATAGASCSAAVRGRKSRESCCNCTHSLGARACRWLATGEIPSRTLAGGARAAGAWRTERGSMTGDDVSWREAALPTALRQAIDRFHFAAARSTAPIPKLGRSGTTSTCSRRTEMRLGVRVFHRCG